MRVVLIGLLCAKGAPGVTTSSVAIAAEWPRPAVVVDADPSGGDIAAGLGRGAWPAGCHLLELVARCRTEPIDAALRALVVRAGEHAPLALAGLGQPRPGRRGAVGVARARPRPPRHRRCGVRSGPLPARCAAAATSSACATGSWW